MADNHDTTRDLAWYRSRWDELANLLSVSDPEEVVPEVEQLHERAEALTAQHETLTEAGMDDSRHALRMIENMKEQLHELYAEKVAAERAETPGGDTFEQLRAFHASREKLQRQIGVSTAENILDMVESLTDQLETFYLDEQPRSAPEDQSPRARRTVHPDIDPLVSDAERNRLEDMTDEELDALSVGAFCVNDQGDVRRANEKALGWPGVTADVPAALEGRNFFTELAPGTDAPLFRGRFDAGVGTGAMDLQFIYGTEAEGGARIAVHLHRKPDSTINWILFRPR
jgi:hypothetical protein